MQIELAWHLSMNIPYFWGETPSTKLPSSRYDTPAGTLNDVIIESCFMLRDLRKALDHKVTVESVFYSHYNWFKLSVSESVVPLIIIITITETTCTLMYWIMMENKQGMGAGVNDDLN